MNPADSSFLVVSAATIGFVLAYVANPPAPRYYPLDGVWRMEHRPETPSMGWYGRSAWGMAAAGVSGAIVWTVARSFRNGDDEAATLSDGSIRLLTLLVLASLVFLAVHIVLDEFPVSSGFR